MKKRSIGCALAKIALMAAGALLVLWLIQVGLVLRDAKKAGLLDDVKTEKYEASRDNNLKAIHQALMRSQESEGTLPPAANWMDAALVRLKTSDLTEDEAKAKLKRPGQKSFGYSINSSMAGKDTRAIRVKVGTILVFESQSTAWNASGDPAKDAIDGGKAVTLEGEVVNSAK